LKSVTQDEFFAQPIEQIILDKDFVKISLSSELCSPYMWEITMRCTWTTGNGFTFLDKPMPFAQAKFYKLFIPITHNSNIPTPKTVTI